MQSSDRDPRAALFGTMLQKGEKNITEVCITVHNMNCSDDDHAGSYIFRLITATVLVKKASLVNARRFLRLYFIELPGFSS